MQLNLCGHSLSINISCFTPAPLLRWWIIFTGKSTQSQFTSHTAVSQCEMFTLLQHKQMFTMSKFTIRRYQNIFCFTAAVSCRTGSRNFLDAFCPDGKHRTTILTWVSHLESNNCGWVHKRLTWWQCCGELQLSFKLCISCWMQTLKFLRILKNSLVLPENRLAKAVQN